jgi:choline dehydrogenase-like flavoprotein
MHEIIIIGSGPSGVASALEFSHHDVKPLVLDVGYESESAIESQENLYILKENKQTTQFLIGEDFEYFKSHKQKVPAKLKSPYFQFVTKDPNFFSVIHNNNIITSYAKGGLANAWGNGLMRFSKDEFAELPISLDDLLPFYVKLENEIGISGMNDDLIDFFGKSSSLQDPLKRSKKAKIIYDKYQEKKEILNIKGIYLGAPRLGVSNNSYDVRDKCNYDNLEFWQPNNKSLYSPSMTLDKLINANKLDYQNSVFIDRWERVGDVIEVIAYNINTKKETRFQTKKLLLAAGSLNTSRIVLRSKKDYSSKLSLIDNPSIQIPIFFPHLIGDAMEIDCFGLTQLNLFYKSEILNKNNIGSILEISSPLRSEFLSRFPFGLRDNINFIKYVLPCMMACQIFLPSMKASSSEIMLLKSGNINVNSKLSSIPKNLISEAVTTLKALGMLTFESFAMPSSNSIHYGGTLPMSENPSSPYETTTFGELSQDKDIFILDGSCFGSIPATNYSLSVMANSMRISQNIATNL